MARPLSEAPKIVRSQMEDDSTVKYEQFVKLIRVLEDALERAAAILSPEASPVAANISNVPPRSMRS